MPDSGGPSPARAGSRDAIGANPAIGEGASADAQHDDACPQAPPAEQSGQAQAIDTASLTALAPMRTIATELDERVVAPRPVKRSMSTVVPAGAACAWAAARWPPCA